MTARISPASRVALVAAALFAIGVAINLRLIAKARHPATPATMWNAATIDAELAPLISQLPRRCTIGWLPSSSVAPPREAEPLYLLQYALTPRIVIASPDPEWLITDSSDQKIQLIRRPAK